MKPVHAAFERQTITLPISSILPLKQIKMGVRTSQKYQQVLASVREIGVIEPVVVFQQKDGTYLLLDGHIRLEALKQLGKTEAYCLISSDDEAYTYNKRINRMAIIQEHAMILKAIRSGVSEERVVLPSKTGQPI